MEIKSYDKLCNESKCIRIKVFVEEQGFREEFDTDDNISTHLVVFDGERAVATGRFYYDETRCEYLIGRLAVLREYRSQGIGAQLVYEAERLIRAKGGKSVSLHAQCRAKAFYEKLGYTAYGESDFDENCPHQWMKKIL